MLLGSTRPAHCSPNSPSKCITCSPPLSIAFIPQQQCAVVFLKPIPLPSCDNHLSQQQHQRHTQLLPVHPQTTPSIPLQFPLSPSPLEAICLDYLFFHWLWSIQISSCNIFRARHCASLSAVFFTFSGLLSRHLIHCFLSHSALRIPSAS